MNGIKDGLFFIPFGAQYYRAPTPLRENWEKDLEAIRQNGFNTIKIWIQWRWNNPAEGIHDFEDTDRIMDIAERLGLHVVINLIFDTAPAWFYQRYPEAVMVTCDGRRVEPQVTAWRQAGGAPGPCYNHPEGIWIRNEFLAAAVKRYKDHPALYLWDIWNEPELTCGILREAVQKDMVCYCSHCLNQFTQWLIKKYKSVDGLNHQWKRNYRSWDEIEVPRCGDTYGDMIDWRTFFADTLTLELKRRVETTKGIDPGTPVMVHTVPIPYFNMINCCNNDFALADLCDMFGNSTGSSPFSAAFNTSCAKGKRVINAEIHALGGETLNRPAIPSFEDIKRHIFIPLARGIKGFLYWQYKPEILGREAPAWGLTRLDGSKTPWLEWSRDICNMLQEHGALIESVKPVPSEIAVINSYKGQIFSWCASNSTEPAYASLMGAFMAMYDNGYNADILEQDILCEEELRRYKLVYLPFPYFMSQKAADTLRMWVEAGGCLVSEAFFGSYVEEEGIHSETVPGCGFTEVFGAAEGRVITFSSFRNAYGSHWAESAGDKKVSLVPVTRGGQSSEHELTGYGFIEELVPDKALTLYRFSNGMDAVTANCFGKGKAVLVGSLLGYSYHHGYTQGMREFLYCMVEMAGIKPNITISGGAVRGDLLLNDSGGAVVLLASNENRSLEVDVHIAMMSGEKKQLTNLMTGKDYVVEAVHGRYTAKLPLQAMGYEIYSL